MEQLHGARTNKAALETITDGINQRVVITIYVEQNNRLLAQATQLLNLRTGVVCEKVLTEIIIEASQTNQ